MAMSVKRRIERNLPAVMGQRDPEAMIRVRSTDPITASGLVPRQQAGHMTASDYTSQNAIKPLPAGGHPHMTVKVSPTTNRLGAKRPLRVSPVKPKGMCCNLYDSA